MIRRAGVAWRKRNAVRKDRTRKQVERGAPKGQEETVEGPGMQIGIENPSTRLQLRLKIKRTPYGFDRKAFVLEFVKRTNGMFSGLRKVRNWTLWRGRPPSKRLKTLLA
jgi:hypothetical protein